MDEELLTATIRHIIWDKSPTLLVQNIELVFGIGPYFHFLLVPFYFVTNFNFVVLGVIPSLVGVVTTFLIYSSGKIMGGKKLGLLAAFLYASSFLISIFDRRLWLLSLDSLICSLSLLAILKVLKGQQKYFLVLALPFGFALNADPSITVTAIAAVTSILVFKINLKNKYLPYCLAVLAVFVLPFFAAEIFYEGSVAKSIALSFLRPFFGTSVSPVNFSYYDPGNFIDVLGRTLATRPSDFVEMNFIYANNYPSPLFSPLPQIIAALFIVTCLYLLFQKQGYKDKNIKTVWIFFLSFVLGIIIFNGLFRGGFYQHYFVAIFPVITIMFAQAILFLNVRFKYFALIFCGLFFLVNLNSLTKSSMHYPLYRKIELVNKTVQVLENQKYSLEATQDPWVQSGGWTELLIQKKNFPVNSYLYSYLGWIYETHGLYPEPLKGGGGSKIVFIKLDSQQLDNNLPIIASNEYKDMQVLVLENESQSDK